MKIVKYSKKGSNKYKVYLEDNTSILLHEDIILKNDLLIKKTVEDKEELIKQNGKYEILDVSLKYLAARIRSTKEMEEYLNKKGYLDKDIELVINYLLEKNYLNDKIYSRNYIMDRINLSNDGPRKIINYLESQNINENIYGEFLHLFTKEMIFSKINKYINHMVKINKKSKYVLKNKIITNLSNLGYERDDINICLNDILEIDDSQNKEIQRNKLYNKLKRKYSGEELERKIKEKLYQLGYFE